MKADAQLVAQVQKSARIRCGAFLDVETTGLSPVRNEILELAIILFAFDEQSGRITGILEEYVGLREPDCDIPSDAIAIHGITEEMVKGHRLDEERIQDMLNRAEFVVAHNARFDYGFVVRLFPGVASKPWLCSMSQISWRAYGYPSKGLQSLLAAHCIPVDTAHRAAADCRGALLLLNHVNPRGDTYLRELLQYLSNPAVGMPAASA
ncbi:MAG: DNA polymerase III subunit epsilon [Firmicutes bacterium]|jgi:DNA polymerase-3 subunit epsilon|nr:DNA polymerase III subunit epsilon [Bacillota bacterium]